MSTCKGDAHAFQRSCLHLPEDAIPISGSKHSRRAPNLARQRKDGARVIHPADEADGTWRPHVAIFQPPQHRACRYMYG